MIQLEVFGKPVPWSAPQISRGRAYDPKCKEKEAIRWQIKGQYRDKPISGPVLLDITFYREIPKGTSKIRRLQMLNGLIIPMSRPDTTNLFKLYEDCLNGIVIEDDNQCSDTAARQRYSERPGALIRVVPKCMSLTEAALYSAALSK